MKTILDYRKELDDKNISPEELFNESKEKAKKYTIPKKYKASLI